MPILSHIFKKLQKKQAGPQRRQKQEQKTDSQEQQTQKAKVVAKKRTTKGASAMKAEHAHGAYNVIVRPHISEKSVSHNNEGKYVFEIYPGINKKEVAKAIESVYKVKVESVNRIKMPRKLKRHMRHKNLKFRYGKAVVTLEKGQEIEVLPQ